MKLREDLECELAGVQRRPAVQAQEARTVSDIFPPFSVSNTHANGIKTERKEARKETDGLL